MAQPRRSWPLVSNLNPRSSISEAYKILRTNIDFSNYDNAVHTIMITSCSMAEGKSTTAANLAVTYGQTNRNVLVIDADMRKPSQHHAFQISNRYGLSSVLSKQSTIQEALQLTSISNVTVMTSGPIPPNPSELLASKRMTSLIEELKADFDIIIVDTPPIIAITDAQIMANKCDGVILVVDSGKVKNEIALKAKSMLDHVQARILGVVLNKKKRVRNDDYYYYYGEREK
ncbi:CpsD/CapB family tyrosine-protein kinase [Paenibacillus eucommiae]|uniref:Capsular exopolysaccharide synthesis family protein n=1 Tax=Paenibacillus eucommiae TaxID=1355755 RepID=A0ABS4IRV9_9BACL|nr:CpsD/CapB family tyrosine-protein kinase [Paenibacillus eucommiae]MBP1990300.1 capsular exopolysaccharide synthesis family protein [Paenibacillus eucommiae]